MHIGCILCRRVDIFYRTFYTGFHNPRCTLSCEKNRNKIVANFKKFISDDKNKAHEIFEKVDKMDIEGIQTLISSDSRDINTFRKAKFLREIFRYVNEFNDCGDILSAGINGDHSMLRIRNHFAHTTSENLGAKQNSEKCKEIREILCLQLGNINNIYDKI